MAGKIFTDQYPWVAVGISFVVLAVSYGLRGTFAVFFVAFLEEFSKSRSATAGIVTMCYVIWAVISPVVGTVVDRFGVRLTFILGGAFLLLGMVLASESTQFWHLYLFFGVFLSVGLSLLDITPITAFIDHWHTKSKGKAFGIAFSGRGIALFLFLPLSQYLVSALGWRLCLKILGVLLFGLILGSAFLVRTRGQVGVSGGKSKRVPAENSVTAGDALSSLKFWRLFFIRVFSSYGIYAVMTHMVAYLNDLGFSKIYGATVMGLIGVMGFGGALILGYASDYLGRAKAMIIGFIVSGLGVVFLVLLRPLPFQWIIILFLVFFGLGYGTRGPVVAALASDLFSGRSIGVIYGFMALGVGIGQASGPWFAGFLFDRTGDYHIPFISVALSFFFCIALTWGIERGKSKGA